MMRLVRSGLFDAKKHCSAAASIASASSAWGISIFLLHAATHLGLLCYCGLAHCHCRHLSSQLVELEHMIDHMMQEEFLQFCTHDVNRPITEHRTPADEVTSSLFCC